MTPREADAAQTWAGMDGAIAFQLIERHADNWDDVGQMMDAWLRANAANVVRKPQTDDDRDMQLGEMKRRACIAHTLCYELSKQHPDIAELGDDGKLHRAIHDVLGVDTPSAKVTGPMPGESLLPAALQPSREDSRHD